MKQLAALLLAACTLAISGCGRLAVTPSMQQSPQGPPKVIWAGNSAGYSIRWTTIDISAIPLRKSGGPVLTELGLTIFDFHQASRMQTGDCDFVRVTELQSVVGSLVSILDNDTMKCANGATGSNRKTVVVNMRQPATAPLLTDYFPQHEISSLITRVGHFCPSKPTNLLNGFAFDELHGNAVTVTITLPPTCSESSLNVALNVPDSLRVPLKLAAGRRQGFLLKDQPAVSHGQTTTINYHYRTAST